MRSAEAPDDVSERRSSSAPPLIYSLAVWLALDRSNRWRNDGVASGEDASIFFSRLVRVLSRRQIGTFAVSAPALIEYAGWLIRNPRCNAIVILDWRLDCPEAHTGSRSEIRVSGPPSAYISRRAPMHLLEERASPQGRPSLKSRNFFRSLRELILLAPSGEPAPRLFRRCHADAERYYGLLSEMQRLRGAVYLRDGAIPSAQIADGRHRSAATRKAGTS